MDDTAEDGRRTRKTSIQTEEPVLDEVDVEDGGEKALEEEKKDDGKDATTHVNNCDGNKVDGTTGEQERWRWEEIASEVRASRSDGVEESTPDENSDSSNSTDHSSSENVGEENGKLRPRKASVNAGGGVVLE